MTRARAFVSAVPQPVWTAVAGLALLASLAVAAVIGAGLSVWRSAVGTAAAPPRALVEPPSSGLIVLPGAGTPRPPAPHPLPPATPSGGTPTPVTLGPIAVVGTPGSPTTVTPVPRPSPAPAPAPVPDFGSRGVLDGSGSHTGSASHAAHVRNDARSQHRYEARHAKHAKHARHAAGKHRGNGHRDG